MREFIQIGVEDYISNRYVINLYLIDTVNNVKIYKSDCGLYTVNITKIYDILSNSMDSRKLDFDLPNNVRIVTCSYDW